MINTMILRRKKRKRHGRRNAADGTQALSRDIVFLGIFAGAGMWSHALVNIATRTL